MVTTHFLLSILQLETDSFPYSFLMEASETFSVPLTNDAIVLSPKNLLQQP